MNSVILTEGCSLPTLCKVTDLVASVEKHIDRIQECKLSGRPIGPITGFPTLDAHLCGVLPSGLNVLVGNTGVGKSALALQIAYQCRCPALYVTCEMQPTELLFRLTAMATETDIGYLKKPDSPLDADEIKSRVREATSEVDGLFIADATTGYCSREWLQEQVTLIQKELGQLLIIVDSVHSWIRNIKGASAETEYDVINRGLDSLQQLVSTVNCPLIYIAEQSRAAKADVNAPRGSGRIEYSAETVMNLITDEKSDEFTGLRNSTLKLTKNRNGESGAEIQLSFNGAMQLFAEIIK